MDFSTLNRRQLQALCKRNAIPANITNVAMADSLQALDHVEGLEDLLNQSPEKTVTGSVSALRTAGRTATRRKPIKEPESSQPLTSSRGGRKPVTEKVDQEMTEVPKTPVAPSTRRRAPLASARQKTENTLVQSVYNTRRSVRLLEKNLSKLNLDNENSMPLKMDELYTEINGGSEKSDGSVDKGSDMQTVSEVSSERVEVSEVQFESKPNGPEENVGQLADDLNENNKTDMIEVGNGILEAEVMDESYGEGSDETDEKESYDEGTANSLATKVSAEVKDLETAAQSSLLPKVNGSMSEEKPTDPNLQALTINLSCEQQSFVGSKSSAVSGERGDYNQKFDFESESATEEEFSEDEATNEEPIDCSKGSDMHGEEGEFDESDSNTEVDDGSSTEEESIEEDSDDSTDEKEEETSEDEVMDEKPIESQNNTSDDVQANVTEVAEQAVVSQFNPLSDEMPKSAKSMSPHHPLAAHEETPQTEMEESKNSEAAPLGNQFPRPALSNPEKSAGKKQSEILSYIFDDENDVEMGKAGDAKSKEDKSQLSIRQLKKMLKIKLNTVDNKAKMEEKPRIPLQDVPENQVAVNKAGNAN